MGSVLCPMMGNFYQFFCTVTASVGRQGTASEGRQATASVGRQGTASVGRPSAYSSFI